MSMPVVMIMLPEDASIDPVGVLADEFMARYRRGERPALSEYTQKHPELAERIRQVFPMMAMMEEATPADESDEAADAARPALATPPNQQQLGGYRILREIGRGGMGVVYEAVQLALGRRVALKVLRWQGSRDDKSLERFRREARAAARLHHTNIVPVYEVGEVGDVCFYAMQYINGQPLDQVVEELRGLHATQAPAATQEALPGDADRTFRRACARSLWLGAATIAAPTVVAAGAAGSSQPTEFSLRPAPAAEAARIGAESSSILDANPSSYHRNVARIGLDVVQALACAHREGIVHRDVKPSNLLLDTEGGVWITDFGLAKTDAEPLTATGDVPGTLRYMPPERFHGWSDPRSDIYSLGLTLYEMLLLRPAFAESNRARLTYQIENVDPPRLRKVDRRVPRDLATIVTKAIDKEPSRRYQTADELAADLQRFLEDRPILARQTGMVERTWRWCRRQPARAAVTAMTLVLVLFVGGGWVWYERQQQTRNQEFRGTLARATLLRDQGRWGEARAAAAPVLEAVGASAEVRAQINELFTDLRMLELVAEIRGSKGDHFDDVDTDAEYLRAFRDYGIDVEVLPPADAGSRIRARPDAVARELVAALDEWALERRRRNLSGTGWRRLLAIAQAADTTPLHHQTRDLLERRDATALGKLAAEADVTTLSAPTLLLIGQILAEAGDRADAVAWLWRAQRRRPGDVWINYSLGYYLRLTPGRLDDAIGFYRAAVAVRPELSHQLAHALEEKGDGDEAIAQFVELTRLRPSNANHHNCLANALLAKGRLVEALAAIDRALDIKRDFGQAHNNRGNVLQAMSHWEEAIAAHTRALDFKSDYASAYNGRGVALLAKGQLKEALTDCDRALELKSDLAEAHNNRGHVLQAMNRLEDALAAYNLAVFHKPSLITAHMNRGALLLAKARPQEALVAFDEAVARQPDSAKAHFNRGNALAFLGRLDDAIAAFRVAIDKDAGLAEAHCNLGQALLSKGRFQEALASLRRGDELSKTRSAWKYPSTEWVRSTERLIELEKRLPAILRGDDKLRSASERKELADCCRFKGLHAAAARLFQELFDAEPKRAADPGKGLRFLAACSAALAGCGQSGDVVDLDDSARARWRQQAQQWLRADLALWRRLLDSGPPQARQAFAQTVPFWQIDHRLACVRDDVALAKLPQAERDGWRKLWAEVAELVKRP
jgi:serine/threonine protein kinase/Flp pilus assembly protein TadD